MANLKELAKRPEVLCGGHRLCAGCTLSTAARMVLHATDKPVVVGAATGCFEVATTIYPYTAWRSPFIHNAFENVAPTMSGVEAAYEALSRRGKVSGERVFVAFGGDGALYDIGFGSLSGALERGHKMVVVCLNNSAYMNTGIQRSGATPRCADTTTAPVGAASTGKQQFEKDLTAIVAAHGIPYVAQSSVGDWNDLVSKSEKAFAANGPAFINVLVPCTRGWRYDPAAGIDLAQEAFTSCYWPNYEVEGGVWRVKKPKEHTPLVDWLKKQGRFRHLFKKGNEHLLAELQAYVDRKWEKLLQMESCMGGAEQKKQ